MNDLKRIIANNITNLRKSKNLTQLEFAKELNYSDKAISKWERAESIPDVVVLKQIADFFGSNYRLSFK
ncbi:MAG: helix-turn-helix transcriptional regulator [Clostridia bacterium]